MKDLRRARHPLHQVLEALLRESRRPAGGAGRQPASRDNAPPPARPQPEANPASPEAVRRELAIRPDHREADLRALRKRFAAGNHPDRSPLALRAVAEQRMKIANSIIDGEIARRRRLAG